MSRLIVAYFDQAYSANDRLRQCLSFFFSAFLHNSAKHGAFMIEVIGTNFFYILECDESEEALTPLQIMSQLAEWIDTACDSISGIDETELAIPMGNLVLDICTKMNSRTLQSIKIALQFLNKLDVSAVNATDEILVQLDEATEAGQIMLQYFNLCRNTRTKYF